MEFRRLFDVLYYQRKHNPLAVALADKSQGEWHTYSTSEALRLINRISRGMYRYGLRPGDKISIISNNRAIWNFTDMAALQIGVIVVPIYPNISTAEYKFILSDSEAKVVFVQDHNLYEKITSLKPELPALQDIYTFVESEGLPHWRSLIENDDESLHKHVEEIMAGIKTDDLATIIYTSGTTGVPKGVMLSHHNIISNAKSAASVIPVHTYMRVISALPICHIFERMVCYLFMYVGASIYYAERVESIAENLKEVKPHFFTVVPRLMEKMFERIMAKGAELTGLKKRLFDWSIRLADKYEVDKFQGIGYELELRIARQLVFRKWREAVGGEVTGIVSGAAALQPKLAKMFNAAGIALREGYGQTETSPVVAVNRFEPGGCMFGTVGIPIPGVMVKIAEDGEICVKGPNVMLGYYKRPDMTADVIDADGWLHTGDVGTFQGRFLKITDRKKEMFKTSGGKYVAPQVVENLFKESFLIEQIMVLGENRKTVSALIVPSFASLEAWCEENGVTYNSREELLRNPQVVKQYAQIRDGFNKRLGEVERVKRFALIPDEWSLDTGELTPTLKIRRKVVAEKYKDVISGLYHGE